MFLILLLKNSYKIQRMCNIIFYIENKYIGIFYTKKHIYQLVEKIETQTLNITSILNGILILKRYTKRYKIINRNIFIL